MAQEPLEILKSAKTQLSGEQMDYYKERFKKEATEEKKQIPTEGIAQKEIAPNKNIKAKTRSVFTVPARIIKGPENA